MTNLSSDQMIVFYIFTALFSLGVGSFINVVAYRLPIMMSKAIEGEYNNMKGLNKNAPLFNLAYPSSACPGCKQSIKAWQNIPVVSYLYLKGVCSSCSMTIGLRYPLVEAATCVLGVLAAVYFGPTLQCATALLFTYMLVSLFLIDSDHFLLPDSITVPLLWVGLIASTFNIFIDLESSLYGVVAGYLAPCALFWVFKITTGKEGMGQGDFKLMAAIGAFVGWQLLPSLLFTASMILVTHALVQKITNPDNYQSTMPFGPYLAVSGMLILYGYDVLGLIGLGI